jgi:hypothetical protein
MFAAAVVRYSGSGLGVLRVALCMWGALGHALRAIVCAAAMYCMNVSYCDLRP